MTGHVRRRGKNSFELKFNAGRDPVTGKRHIRYSSFKGTKRAAELELARLVSEHDAGNSVDPSKVTVAEFFDRWDHDWASVNVSLKTLERYRQIAKLQIKPTHRQSGYPEAAPGSPCGPLQQAWARREWSSGADHRSRSSAPASRAAPRCGMGHCSAEYCRPRSAAHCGRS